MAFETRLHPIMARTPRDLGVFRLARRDLVKFVVFLEILGDECRKTHSDRHESWSDAFTARKELRLLPTGPNLSR
jgi:hypothetical protein